MTKTQNTPQTKTLDLPIGRAVRHYLEGTQALQHLLIDGQEAGIAAGSDWEVQALLEAWDECRNVRGGGIRISFNLETVEDRAKATGALKVLREYVEHMTAPGFPDEFSANERRAGNKVLTAIMNANTVLRSL